MLTKTPDRGDISIMTSTTVSSKYKIVLAHMTDFDPESAEQSKAWRL